MELRVIDLTHLPEEDAETEARRLFAADVRQLYDLATAPLLRATLVKLAKDDHVFILNFHHIIADGSSLAIFIKNLPRSMARHGTARRRHPICQYSMPIMPRGNRSGLTHQHSPRSSTIGSDSLRIAGTRRSADRLRSSVRPVLPRRPIDPTIVQRTHSRS